MPKELDTAQLAVAALDVLPVESSAKNSRIVQHPRALVFPHAAFYSVVAGGELRRKTAQNLVDWAGTGRPLYVVMGGS
jgi:D-3-phosphoglycerate dehydrogenase